MLYGGEIFKNQDEERVKKEAAASTCKFEDQSVLEKSLGPELIIEMFSCSL
jgi:hypothetical protein